MKTYNWLKEIEKRVKDTDEYEIMSLKLDLSEEIWERMEDLNLSKKDLAKKLKVSNAYITKILSGKSNFTIETLYKIGKALDMRLSLKYEGLESTAGRDLNARDVKRNRREKKRYKDKIL